MPNQFNVGDLVMVTHLNDNGRRACYDSGMPAIITMLRQVVSCTDDGCYRMTHLIKSARTPTNPLPASRTELMHGNCLRLATDDETAFRRCATCNGLHRSANFCEFCAKCYACCRSDAPRCHACNGRYCSHSDAAVCPECLRCENCHAYCTSCEERTCSECDTCGECPNCCQGGHYDDDDDDDRGYGLRGYSTNVVAACHAIIPERVRTFGIELEVAPTSSANHDRILDAIDRSAALRRIWVPKSDGSLPSLGIEIVSVPLSLADLLARIRELFDACELENRIFFHASCGTHVHIGRQGIDPRTILRTWYPFHFASRDFGRHLGLTVAARRIASANQERMLEVLTTLCGRGPTHYCAWAARPPIITRGASRGRGYDNGHYSVVSYSQHCPTYEVRAFAGADTMLTAQRYAETVDMLLRIGQETHGYAILTQPDLFLEEVSRRIGRYQALDETMRTEGGQLSGLYVSVHSPKKAVHYRTPFVDHAPPRYETDQQYPCSHVREALDQLSYAERDAQRRKQQNEREALV